jgi:hypothetical protein
MELPIKQEPLFEDDFVQLSSLESGNCCFLCPDGQRVFRELMKHFRVSHGEGEWKL